MLFTCPLRCPLSNQPTSHSTDVITRLQVISSAIVQLYFAHRLYKFSGSPGLAVVVVILTIGQFGVGTALSVQVNLVHNLQNIFYRERPLMVSWLILEALDDLVIAFSVSYFFRRRRTGIPSTDSALRLLTTYAINSGVLTSAIAIVIMFDFALYGLHFVHFALCPSLGGIYTGSLLANLHSRKRARERLLPDGDNIPGIRLSLPPDTA
ncbi:uncharacterized protein EI90DRAFT_1173379 [Cantharellus anzutake]|uniref:uncharacterized protein n=1 Tax=Cantharellus anzutake TaxID=1750568 RepID=UPI00190736C9|nr:uncharacterized protein EI90DRAFT_1173379 [Cantharellus anzutake]KAF8330300.1 hypothetical protein EI90DRAFT_1173379 [Cantharellus anzutake]